MVGMDTSVWRNTDYHRKETVPLTCFRLIHSVTLRASTPRDDVIRPERRKILMVGHIRKQVPHAAQAVESLMH